MYRTSLSTFAMVPSGLMKEILTLLTAGPEPETAPEPDALQILQQDQASVLDVVKLEAQVLVQELQHNDGRLVFRDL